MYYLFIIIFMFFIGYLIFNGDAQRSKRERDAINQAVDQLNEVKDRLSEEEYNRFYKSITKR